VYCLALEIDVAVPRTGVGAVADDDDIPVGSGVDAGLNGLARLILPDVPCRGGGIR